MNKIKKHIMSLLFIISFICFFSVTVFADETANVTSKPISEPAVNIDEVLNSEKTVARIKEGFSSPLIDSPKDYTYDTSIYLLEYNVSRDYWDNVASFDYRGLTSPIYYQYPTIYLPVFADIADSNGNISERVIGHARIWYNVNENDYRVTPSICNLSYLGYKDNPTAHFYEEIRSYINQSETPIQQVFLIRYPDSFSTTHEMIAVLQTEKDVIILDIGDTCHAGVNGQSPVFPISYSVEEYYSLRKPLEKNLYQYAEGWEENPVGGQVDVDTNNFEFDNILICTFIAISALLLLVVICVILRKYYKNRKSSEKSTS